MIDAFGARNGGKNKLDELELETTINIQSLGYEFLDKPVFVGDYANCKHCHNERKGACHFRKIYTIDDRLIEKCNGNTFEFYNPCLDRMGDYMTLFQEFYPNRKR
jgi:hypothetical protein